MGEPHNDKVLHDFKLVIKHQMILLRNACGAQTAYFYWINRSRKQFVLESRSTKYTRVMFQDRISFDQHFLNPYKDIRQIKRLQVGSDTQIDPAALTHYSSTPPISNLTLIPLQHNAETVALTVVEHEEDQDEAALISTLDSYVAGLENMMETYMEINKLSQNEIQWEQYENELSSFEQDYKSSSVVEMLAGLTSRLAGYLSKGGVVLMGREGSDWVSLWNERTSGDEDIIIPGLKMEQNSIAGECSESQQIVYLSHLNGSPKRISSREPEHRGATLAVPVYINHSMEGMILLYDQNPLVFKESMKHMMINLIRTASRMVTIRWNQSQDSDPLRTDGSKLYRKEMWHKIVAYYLSTKNNGVAKLGLGRLKLTNHHELRTRLRLEQLHELEHRVIRSSRPLEVGLPGLVGEMKEYEYAIILPIVHEETLSYYKKKVMERLGQQFELHNNEMVDIETEINFTEKFAGETNPDVSALVESLQRREES